MSVSVMPGLVIATKLNLPVLRRRVVGPPRLLDLLDRDREAQREVPEVYRRAGDGTSERGNRRG